jgi:hypothetical protein
MLYTAFCEKTSTKLKRLLYIIYKLPKKREKSTKFKVIQVPAQFSASQRSGLKHNYTGPARTRRNKFNFIIPLSPSFGDLGLALHEPTAWYDILYVVL